MYAVQVYTDCTLSARKLPPTLSGPQGASTVQGKLRFRAHAWRGSFGVKGLTNLIRPEIQHVVASIQRICHESSACTVRSGGVLTGSVPCTLLSSGDEPAAEFSFFSVHAVPVLLTCFDGLGESLVGEGQTTATAGRASPPAGPASPAPCALVPVLTRQQVYLARAFLVPFSSPPSFIHHKPKTPLVRRDISRATVDVIRIEQAFA